MTDTTTINHTAKLKVYLAQLDQEIRERQEQISWLQDELDDLEVTRCDLLDQLDKDDELDKDED